MMPPTPTYGERVAIEPFAKPLIRYLGQSGVYALTDPCRMDAVAYVGQSYDMICRYFEHLRASRGMSPQKVAWSRELQEAGHVPGLLILELVDRAELLKRESYWIALYKAVGLAWLNGQVGTPPPVSLLFQAEEQLILEARRLHIESHVEEGQDSLHLSGQERRAYRGILAKRAAYRQQLLESQEAVRLRIKEEDLRFEERVEAEVQRRMADHNVQWARTQRQFRVRARNASRLGLATVEMPG